MSLNTQRWGYIHRDTTGEQVNREPGQRRKERPAKTKAVGRPTRTHGARCSRETSTPSRKRRAKLTSGPRCALQPVGNPRCRQATARLHQTHTGNTQSDSYHHREHRHVSRSPPIPSARKYKVEELAASSHPVAPKRGDAVSHGAISIDTSRQGTLRQTQRSSNRGWQRWLPSPLLRRRHPLLRTSQRRRQPLVLGHRHAPRPVRRQRSGAAWLLSP